MKRKTAQQLTVFSMTALLLLSAVGCQDATMYLSYSSLAHFGTTTQWVFSSRTNKASDEDTALWKEISARLTEIENSLSEEVATSSVARFNRAAAGEKVEIDETAYSVLTEAKRIYTETDGAYNPAVGLLVDLWAFSPRFTSLLESDPPTQPYDRADVTTELPAEEYRLAFMQLSDFSAVTLSEEEGKYYAVKPTASVELPDKDGTLRTYTMQINLGGIGKGYAVDEAERLIRAAGHTTGYFQMGSSSICLLQDSTGTDGVWTVGLNNPRGSGTYASVKQKDISLSSSGDYEQYYYCNGVRYCHIINPATGYPVNAEPTDTDGSGIVMASVFGLTAEEGDATTTALMVMGREGALSYLKNKLPDVEYSFVYFDGTAKEYSIYTNLSEEKLTVSIDGAKVVRS